jgi:hypothetical protein
MGHRWSTDARKVNPLSLILVYFNIPAWFRDARKISIQENEKRVDFFVLFS